MHSFPSAPPDPHPRPHGAARPGHTHTHARTHMRTHTHARARARRWMLSFSDEGQSTKQPGYMATLLAPNDGAVWEALRRLGGWQLAGDGC
jgi:hypothetical protein